MQMSSCLAIETSVDIITYRLAPISREHERVHITFDLVLLRVETSQSWKIKETTVKVMYVYTVYLSVPSEGATNGAVEFRILMGKTTLPIDVDCHVFLLFSFERMKFDLLVLCVFCSSCWFHSGAVPNFSWTWDVGIAEQYHKPPWWWLHLNTSRCSSFPLAANLGKFTLITSNHFFEKLPQSICAPISRPLKDFFPPRCVCDGLEKDALMLSPDIVLLVFSWPPTVMKQIIHTHTKQLGSNISVLQSARCDGPR